MEISVVGLMAVAALMFAMVPSEGASVHTDTIDVSTNAVEHKDTQHTSTLNTTTATDDEMDFFSELSSTTQHDQDLSTTENNDVSLPRVRRWTEMTAGKLQSSAENLQGRSKCPWTYSYNTDPTREPQTLMEAQCRQLKASDLAGQCEHIHYYVPVKQNVSGTWTDHWIWLRVGCTLATPLSAPPPITFD